MCQAHLIFGDKTSSLNVFEFEVEVVAQPDSRWSIAVYSMHTDFYINLNKSVTSLMNPTHVPVQLR